MYLCSSCHVSSCIQVQILEILLLLLIVKISQNCTTALKNQVLSYPKFPVRTPGETDSKEQEKGSLACMVDRLGTTINTISTPVIFLWEAMQRLNWVTQGSFLAAAQVWIDAVLETTLCQDIKDSNKQSIKHTAQANNHNRTFQSSFWKCLLGSVPSVQKCGRVAWALPLSVVPKD